MIALSAYRLLGIRVDQQCFDKPDRTAGALLDLRHGRPGAGRFERPVRRYQMANGSAADMMNQSRYSASFGAVSSAPMGGGGGYGAYP